MFRPVIAFGILEENHVPTLMTLPVLMPCTSTIKRRVFFSPFKLLRSVNVTTCPYSSQLPTDCSWLDRETLRTHREAEECFSGEQRDGAFFVYQTDPSTDSYSISYRFVCFTPFLLYPPFSIPVSHTVSPFISYYFSHYFSHYPSEDYNSWTIVKN